MACTNHPGVCSCLFSGKNGPTLFAYKPCESIYDQISCACCLRILFHFQFPTLGWSLRPKQEAIFSVCFQLRRIQSFPWSEPRGPEIYEVETHNVALLKLLQAVTYSHILYTSCIHLTHIILCTLFGSCPLLQKHKLPFKWSVVSSKCPALCQKTLGSRQTCLMQLHDENEQDWQHVYPSDRKTTRKDTFQHNTNPKCLDLEKENASSVNSFAQPLPGLCLMTSKCMTTSICQS